MANKKIITLVLLLLVLVPTVLFSATYTNQSLSSGNYPEPQNSSSNGSEMTLFTNDFEDQQLDDWTLEPPAAWTILTEGDNHFLEGKSSSWAKVGANNWLVISLELELLLLVAPIGISIRDYSARDFVGRYILELSEASVKLKKSWSNQFTYLATEYLSLEKNSWYKVRVEFNGPDIVVYLNGEEILQTTDANLMFCGGLRLETPHAYFNNIVVTGAISMMGANFADFGHPIVVPDGYVASNIYTTKLVSPWDLDFGPDGILYVAEDVGCRVCQVFPNGSVIPYVEFTGEYLGHATGLAFNPSGELFVSVGSNGFCAILKVLPDRTITKFVQFDQHVYSAINQLAINASGDIFACHFDGIISKVTPEGDISTFTSGFDTPSDLEFGPDGNLYVFDWEAGSLYQVDPFGVKSLFATGLQKQESYLAFAPNGDLYVMQTIQLFRIPPNGSVIPLGPIEGIVPDRYNGIRFDAEGNLYAAAGTSSKIVKVFANNTATALVDGFMSTGLTVSPTNLVYAIDTASIQMGPQTTDILKLTPDGSSTVFVTVSNVAMDVVCDNLGNLLVATFNYYNKPGNGKILKISPTGTITTFASGLNVPCSIDLSPSGALHVLDSYSGDVITISPTGVIATFATGFPQVDEWFEERLVVGPQGTVYVALYGTNNSIYQIFQNGSISLFNDEVVDDGNWDCGDLTITDWGDIYITESGAGKLHKVTQEETTLIAAKLYNDPHGLTCNSAGEFFIGRSGSISKVSPVIYLYRTFVSVRQAEVDSTQTIGIQTLWGHNNTVATQAAVQVNGTNYLTNSSGWFTFNVSSGLKGQQRWQISSVSCNGIVEWLQLAPSPTIIWNGITTTITNATTPKAITLTTIMLFVGLTISTIADILIKVKLNKRKKKLRQ